MTSLINKGRKPKFELHLKIYDLNNVPLVTGTSSIKWYLPHSIHGEHRGRTAKCPIANHRVEYNYSRLVQVRIGIDKSNNLQECPIEFEVSQEFGMANGSGVGGGKDEKITLGLVKLNLSEYVEESEAVARDSLSIDLAQYSSPGGRGSASHAVGARRRSSTAHRHHYHRHDRHRSGTTASSAEGVSPTRRPSAGDEAAAQTIGEDVVQDGIIRRYLMHDSKVNSTLKIGILMIQVDGDRSYVAPPLKTAPVFGGIAGLMGAEPVEGNEDIGQLPNLSKSRDASEHQDMYRRALAASWCCQPNELPAHECIEDIFSGGTGWRPDKRKGGHRAKHTAADGDGAEDSPDERPTSWRGGGPAVAPRAQPQRLYSHGASEWEESATDNGGDPGGTIKASDIARMKHLRAASGTSDRSSVTVIGPTRHSSSNGSDPFLSPLRRAGDGNGGGGEGKRRLGLRSEETITPASIVAATARENESKKVPVPTGNRSRSESIASLATTLGSEGRPRYDGYRRQREVDEFEVRENLVAWSLPGSGDVQA